MPSESRPDMAHKTTSVQSLDAVSQTPLADASTSDEPLVMKEPEVVYVEKPVEKQDASTGWYRGSWN